MIFAYYIKGIIGIRSYYYIHLHETRINEYICSLSFFYMIISFKVYVEIVLLFKFNG